MLKLPIKIYRFILIGCAVLISVAIISILGFPKLMKIMIKKEINLKLNSETRQMWQNFPIPIMFSIYVFNVTNPQEVLTGDKPKLKEIGPFVFEEWKDKYDIEDIDNEDAVEFNMRNTFIFRPDLGLSGKEFITMPHPLIQSNHSDAGRFKVSRGIRNNRMIGQVLEFEGEEELNVWPGEECNRLRGTDSTIFAPLMKPHEGLWAFSADLCRSLGPQFQKKVKYNGIQALRYTMDFGDVKNEPENQCFCKDYPDDCPAKGTMDLSLCNETPMIASMPHFLNGDPKLLENIEGLQPSEEKHGIFIDFEIISGTPLSVAKRLQFNLDVEPVEELPVMSKLKPLVMPLFWIEEAVDLDKSFTDIIKSKVFTTKKVVMIIMWNFVVIGLCGAVFAGVMLYLRKNDLIQVTDIRSNVGNNAN
ncbi:sensory neuron membrane protein 1-like isoform 2-T2 [Cochliomyia hominivorax]